MELAVLVAALVAALAAIAALVAVLRRRDRGPDMEPLVATQNELAGRLSQLAEQGNQAQVALTKTLNEGIEKSAVRTAETLGDIKKHLNVIDQAHKTIGELRKDVVGLQEIFSNKQSRGVFGETQLFDLVANVLPQGAYESQATLSNGRRADCLIRLPNPPGPIAIDAKFPLESFRALREANDEAAMTVAQRAFVQDIRKHIKDIAERYVVPGETAESAVMFLPSEAVYAELHDRFIELVEESHRARVWIVSPTTLWALLHTVRAVLKDARMHEQAGLIQQEVGKLMDDVRRLDTRVGKLQQHFSQTEKDVGEILTSTGKIVRTGEKIEGLQFGGDGEDTEALPPD
ncbi:MAG: DNA recombination protein RmuC [Alphaproteobacteria bacterium]|nr:DNA recombination protein RmuC [Alphaproteobacteria bacterium]